MHSPSGKGVGVCKISHTISFRAVGFGVVVNSVGVIGDASNVSAGPLVACLSECTGSASPSA